MTGFDDNYNESRIQCLCLLGTLSTSDANDVGNGCNGAVESCTIFDCIVVHSSALSGMSDDQMLSNLKQVEFVGKRCWIR